MVLEWTPPRRLGGRSDIGYNVECLICQTGQSERRTVGRNRTAPQPVAQQHGVGMQSDQGIVGPEVQPGRGVYQRPGSTSISSCQPCSPDVLFSPSQTDLLTTKVVVSELRAHTHYTFIVYARNGVSQASGSGAASSASVSVTTNQAGECEECVKCVMLLTQVAKPNLLID